MGLYEGVLPTIGIPPNKRQTVFEACEFMDVSLATGFEHDEASPATSTAACDGSAAASATQ